MRTTKDANYNRKRIIENNYLFYMRYMPDSDRNKQIVTKYAEGKSYVELGEEYDLSPERISAIVANYIRHVKIFLNDYKEW